MNKYSQQLLDYTNKYFGNHSKNKITMRELKKMNYQTVLSSAKMAGYNN